MGFVIALVILIAVVVGAALLARAEIKNKKK